jgi:hypothetical protein
VIWASASSQCERSHDAVAGVLDLGASNTEARQRKRLWTPTATAAPTAPARCLAWRPYNDSFREGVVLFVALFQLFAYIDFRHGCVRTDTKLPLAGYANG